jgi:hypothetical protein
MPWGLTLPNMDAYESIHSTNQVVLNPGTRQAHDKAHTRKIVACKGGSVK